VNRAVSTTSAVVVLIGVLATGCGGSTKPLVPQPTSTGASGSGQDPTHAAVLSAYTGMWSDYSTDLLTANWQNPISANHATGQALQTIENALAVDGHHGWIGKGSPVPHPVVKSLTMGPPESAEVVDCLDLSRALLYVAATGKLKDSTPGGWHLVDAGLVMKDGEWKVSTLAMGKAGSC
jgi:hypothetical protein